MDKPPRSPFPSKPWGRDASDPELVAEIVEAERLGETKLEAIAKAVPNLSRRLGDPEKENRTWEMASAFHENPRA